ncbi:MAG: aminoglycoside phosphotransferase (APT) family kinase protein [Natronomonas sp.]|jgi:aminoglycoside phosphotransferase (APT) family kinase protein
MTEADRRALGEFLETRFGATERFRLASQEAGSGSSNRTFFVRWGDKELVLRGAPAHDRVPHLLHDVLAEYDILSALSRTKIPTPDPVAVCADDAVLGTPFYLMTQVTGDAMSSLDDGDLSRLTTPEHRRRMGEEAIDTLASLHTLDRGSFDVREVPEGPIEEAVEAHTAALQEASETTGRELTRALEVADWLRDHVPEPPERRLVHGDYKLDNLLFAPGTPPRIAAVLDWEMAGVGNPLADLGWFVGLWTEERDPDPVTPEFEARYGDHEAYDIVVEGTPATAKSGAPSRAKLVGRYERQTGLVFRHDRFYRALGVYKLVVICEKFHAAYLTRPEDAKATYPVMEVLAPLLAERAALIVEGRLTL